MPSPESPNGKVGNDPSLDTPLIPSNSEDFDADTWKGNQSNPTLSDLAKQKVEQARSQPRTGRQGFNPQDSNVDPRGNIQNALERARSSMSSNQNKSTSLPESGSLMQDADINAQLERHGLGRALQSIVEKTMKEQGESNTATSQPNNKNASSPPKANDNLGKNKAQPSTSTTSTPTANKAVPKNAEIARNNRTNAAPSVPRSNQNANAPSTMSSWGESANKFWGAIRSTPSERGGRSSSNAAGVSGGFGDLEFAWNWRAWLALAFVLLLSAMLLLLARKRVVLASAAKEAEAELAKEILTEGIRTRADVVRAFHRFVLRRAQPVANWWNHRYVAAKLSDASPQLRTVIGDLASVYEHARYLPPEVKLSSEEIDRVQTALKQCAASGV
jgi:hypothetical protein